VHPIKQKLAELAATGSLDLPLPGSGNTASRHAALYELGRMDLSLARLAEAHTDALSILAELGRSGRVGALYGVWASDGPGSRLELHRESDGSLQLNGAKRYCSGAPFLDAALVTAYKGEELRLVEFSLTRPGVTIEVGDWASPAFRETATATVNFAHVAVRDTDVLGGSRWYLERPGFWHGALGPAACWGGGAAGLVDAARQLSRQDPHSRAQLGALEAADWGLRALLRQAGDEIDADPKDIRHQARRRALMARHLIERLCTDTLDRFGRASGPQLLAFDAPVAQRYAELTLYIRQCHGERDLESISPGPTAVTRFS
jgi:alkylation response protein AidB-like acyl-CoA dehydrogenase